MRSLPPLDQPGVGAYASHNPMAPWLFDVGDGGETARQTSSVGGNILSDLALISELIELKLQLVKTSSHRLSRIKNTGSANFCLERKNIVLIDLPILVNLTEIHTILHIGKVPERVWKVSPGLAMVWF